jgi:hypothetical protein
MGFHTTGRGLCCWLGGRQFWLCEGRGERKGEPGTKAKVAFIYTRVSLEPTWKSTVIHISAYKWHIMELTHLYAFLPLT